MSILARAALRAGIPLVIMSTIGATLLVQGSIADGRSTLAAGVIAAAVSGSTVIYEIANWTLTRQSLVHLGVMTVTVLPALFLSGWFALETVRGYLAVVAMFVLVGAVLWTVMYLVFTRLVPSREE